MSALSDLISLDAQVAAAEEDGRPQDALAAVREFHQAHRFPLLSGDTATFFYPGPAGGLDPVDEAFLVHWVFGLETRIALAPIGHTGAFGVAVELPHSGRVEYKLELVRGGRHRWTRDPLNPLQAFDPFGSNSVCTMPGYAAPPWADPDPQSRPGRLVSFPLRSKVWGDTRKVRVYLPSEYHPRKAYPLLICHDGSDYLRFAALGTVLDNLISRHEVSPLIVALVDGGARNDEYGAHPDHPRFIVDEVMPAVAARHKISERPQERGLMGASFGAVASAWTAWSRPGVFGRLLLQSGSFVYTDVGRQQRGPLWEPVVGFVNEWRKAPGALFTDPRTARIYQSCGTFESLIQYNRGLVPRLRGTGVGLRFEEAADGHNWICWRDRLRAGLTWLFPGHLWMYYE